MMSINNTWAISSWISFLISVDILLGDYSQYFAQWDSASFALHTAMTKVNRAVSALCPMHAASLPSLRSPAHAGAPDMSANRDHPVTAFACRKCERVHCSQVTGCCDNDCIVASWSKNFPPTCVDCERLCKSPCREYLRLAAKFDCLRSR